MNDRAFRVVFFTRIGISPWRLYQKQFSDNEKELNKLVKKAKITTDRRNRGVRRECRFVVEELLGNIWTPLEQYPHEEPEVDQEVEKKKRAKELAYQQKWQQIRAAAEEEGGLREPEE